MVGPQNLRDVIGLVLGAGRYPACDCGVGDVNPLIAQRVVKHPRIGDLARERDPDTGTGGGRVYRSSARREEDRRTPAFRIGPMTA